MAFTKEANEKNTLKSMEATMWNWGKKIKAAQEAGDIAEYERCKAGRRALIRKWS
jgi:hypothetical protein|tara:strand:- start:45 stop:209 length:165 start_codon:yes stop_codon:yes gene_type:complete